MGTRPWVWADLYWSQKDEYLKKMPKSVLQSNWWYRPMSKNEDGSFTHQSAQAYIDLDRAGFEQVPTCSAIFCHYCADQTLEFLKEDLSADKLKGFMTAPWYLAEDDSLYALMNDAKRFGSAKKKFYPEYCD